MRHKSAALASVVLLFLLYTLFHFPSSSPATLQNPATSKPYAPSSFTPPAIDLSEMDPGLLTGGSIMPHLGNETLKAQLGHSSWHLLHTLLSRYPKRPTPSDRESLRTFLHLFARLYPCGECGQHFTELLKKYPPQTSSREAASMWGCAVHNRVNERLGKEQFDCRGVVDKYKCGCDDAEEEDAKAELAAGAGGKKVVEGGKEKDVLKGREPVKAKEVGKEEEVRNILDEFGPVQEEGKSRGG
ncbi:hypothetical protein BJ508DRAFT_235824 [Ascobolus immersus RN42]|uniref:Sulfhydryl oxidase n=1 Tax=Ascobolus immersus RN42 TaxID=1160509 RepID=A0A3N4ITR0_ASCIM|nr:hypothetical protein BJ508DRAFT_235824 [Ascobolus immersus RN42]